MLIRSVDTATAARSPLGCHLFQRVGNLTKWAMRLEHLGRAEEAVHRYQESVVALTVATAATPDSRFGMESWAMSNMYALSRARSALLSSEMWRPTEQLESPPELTVEPHGSFEDLLWRAHAEASVALASGQPRKALAVLDGYDEEQYDVIGPRLADRFYLYLLAHAKLGHHAEALVASRNLHRCYDGAAYRSRRERVEAARDRVARASHDVVLGTGPGPA